MPHDVRPVSAAEAQWMRHTLLHSHRALETERNPLDDAADTLHAGAFQDGRLVAITSISRVPFAGAPLRPAWQLRGVAVQPGLRRQGFGAAVVQACIAHAAAHGGGIVWCNGRTSALPFYQSLGFQTYGPEFQVPVTGPHYVLWREA